MPTAVAIQCVEVTTPKVPSISGRVVKGSGLMLLMGIQRCAVSRCAHLTTGEAACQPLGCTHCTHLRDHAEAGLDRIVDGMAGDAVDQRGRFLAAEIERQRAARIEGAAGRRVDRIGDFALDRNRWRPDIARSGTAPSSILV